MAACLMVRLGDTASAAVSKFDEVIYFVQGSVAVAVARNSRTNQKVYNGRQLVFVGGERSNKFI